MCVVKGRVITRELASGIRSSILRFLALALRLGFGYFLGFRVIVENELLYNDVFDRDCFQWILRGQDVAELIQSQTLKNTTCQAGRSNTGCGKMTNLSSRS